MDAPYTRNIKAGLPGVMMAAARMPLLSTAVALLLAVLMQSPTYNWDLLGYIGAVYAYEISDVQELHVRTYAEVERNVPELYYAYLTQASSWRVQVALEPRAFVQHLPFFQVKPAYPALMFLLQQLGMDLVAASIVISKVAWWLMGLLLFQWLAVYLRPWPACLCTMLVMTVPQVMILAGLSSPDALSSLLTLAVFFLLVEKHWYGTALLLACGAISVRHNNLLLLFLVALHVIWIVPGRRLVAVGYLVVGLGGYLFLKGFYDNYSWAVFFHHSVVERLAYPAEFQPWLRLEDYLHIYLQCMLTPTIYTALWWWLLAGLGLCYGQYRMGGVRNTWVQMLLVALLMLMLFWLALPNPPIDLAGRLYVTFYLLLIVCMAATFGKGTVLGRGPRCI